MNPKHAGVAVFVTLIWGFNFGVAKIGLEQLPPVFMMALRFGLVALVLVPFARLPRGRVGELFALSFSLGTVHCPLMFIGLGGIDAAAAAIAVQTQVPFSALIAALMFKDRLGWRRTVGMAVAFGGVAILAGEPRFAGSLWPLAMIIAASFVWAVANVQMKFLGDLNGFAVNGWMSLFAVPQLALVSFIIERGQLDALAAADWRAYAAIAYTAVCVTILGYGLWYRLLHRYPVNQTMPFSLLVPIFGVVSGIVMLGEPLLPGVILGGLLTVAGVGVIVVRRPKAVQAPQPT
jgi:O-acetylserine/cysteine efflux transporter